MKWCVYGTIHHITYKDYHASPSKRCYRDDKIMQYLTENHNMHIHKRSMWHVTIQHIKFYNTIHGQVYTWISQRPRQYRTWDYGTDIGLVSWNFHASFTTGLMYNSTGMLSLLLLRYDRSLRHHFMNDFKKSITDWLDLESILFHSTSYQYFHQYGLHDFSSWYIELGYRESVI